MVAFGVLYALFFFINLLASPLLDIVPGQIALVFLPAFIRVMAVVVAGFAGALGIAIGSFLVSMVLIELPALQAAWVSVASAAGILLSYWILRQAIREPSLPITLPVLLALSVLYSAINAVIHGLTWWFLGVNEQVSQVDLSLMMLGDLFGVVVMFYALRVALRLFSVFLASRSPSG